MANLLYDSGLRLMECIRLRVKDVDFSYNHIVVRDGKGDKDLVTMLPLNVKNSLHRHLQEVNTLHERDLTEGFGSVYLPVDAGAGKPVVLLPGWSQTVAEFKYQFAGLHDSYRLIALNMRGHGDSDKPQFGYTIARLSKDLHEVLVALDLHEVALLGHSMGCAIIWSYWELFGAERLTKFILVDCAPCLTANPAWSSAEREAAGPVVTADALYATCNALAGPDGVDTTKSLLSSTVTRAMSEADQAWLLEQNLQFPRRHAAMLLAQLATQDWRDVIPRITLPTQSGSPGIAVMSQTLS